MTRNKRPLQLDKQNAKWLGVCAGVANFLEVEAWTVRLIFLGSIFFGGWFLVPLYFIAWYLLDENSGKLRSKVMDNHTVKHFRNVDYRKKLYRNTRDGKLMGVCAGIADYFEISAFTVRIVFFVLTFLTVFPVLFYIGAWMILEKRPQGEYYYEEATRNWNSQFEQAEQADRTHANAEAFARAQSRSKADHHAHTRPREQYSKRREFQYAVRKFGVLQQRMARLEAYVTSSRFKLHREFRNMS